jgi:hypothetical protein
LVAGVERLGAAGREGSTQEVEIMT